MAYKHLQEFIEELDKQGELKRITAQVDPKLEISEIAARVMAQKGGGAALLFEKVKGSPYPLAINLFGSEKRMAMAIGAKTIDEKAEEISTLLDWAWKVAKDFNPFKAIPEALPKAPIALSFIPRKTASPICQEVIDDEAGFDSLPVITCWPQDGGPFLTLPIVCTEDPETGRRNMGMYRMQVYDKRASGMHWHIHKDGAHFFEKYKKRGERMPVAVALGCDPAVTYASIAPLPPGVWEMLFAGFLRGKGPSVCKATLSDLLVPADAEFILEGYVDPNEPLRREGPFGDHTGFYSLPDEYPVFHLQRITRRKNPVYPATIVGPPPKEDCWMGKATERLFLPLLKQLCPEIVDLAMPFEGVFHNCAIVSVRKRFPGQVRKVMNFIWGMGQMMYTKCIIAVDEDVNAQNFSEVAWRAFNNVDGKRDLVFSDGPLDALDHSSPLPHFGCRIGIDATRKGPADGHHREWPDALVMDKEIQDLVNRRWGEYGI